MAEISIVKISALPVAEQIGDEDLLALAQDGATKALAYGTIKDDISEELAPDATLSEAGKAADAKAVGDALALKADVTAVTAEVSRIDTALAAKANTNDVNAALATKANADEVAAALALKADASTVNAELATKADTDTVNAALALKADKTEVTAGLAAKQNVLTFDSTPTEGSTNPVTSGGAWDSVTELKNDLSYESNKRSLIGKETFPVEKHLTYAQIPFEHGIVYASNNELVYSTNATGIRTTEIYDLEAGDVISLTDFTQAFIAYLGFYHTDGTWRSLGGNLTEAYTVVYPGRYYVTLKKTGSPNITDVDSVAAYLNITKNKTAFEKVKEYTEENIPLLLKTQAFYNNLDNVNLIKTFFDSVTQGRYNPFNIFSSTVEANDKRICGQFEYDAKSITFRCDNPDYKIAYACYESDGTYITGSGGNAFHDAGIYTVEGNIHYIRYMIAKVSSSATIVPDDIIDAQFYITETINNAARLSDIHRDDFFRLKVATYNIGHFSYGVDPYGIAPELYDTKLPNWFKFFGENEFDICGCQEDYIYIDQAGTVSAEEGFWSKLFRHNAYRYNQSGFGWESLRSKYTLHNIGTVQTVVDGVTRTYRCANIYVNGKDIFLLSVHLYPSQEEDGPIVRAQEFAQIATVLAQKEYYIVFGDFNTMSTSEWDNVLNDGQGNKICNMANGGLFGWKWTYSNNPDDYSHYDSPTGTKVRCLDNILTSKNIQIEYADVINCYSQTTSDHIPVFASLVVY